MAYDDILLMFNAYLKNMCFLQLLQVKQFFTDKNFIESGNQKVQIFILAHFWSDYPNKK